MISATRPRRAQAGRNGSSSASPPLPKIEGAPPAVRLALDAAAGAPASVDRRHRLADALREAAYREQAVDAYRCVIEMDAARATAYRDLGNVLTDSGRPVEGAMELRHALELLPNDPGTILGLLRALHKAKLSSDAMQWVERLEKESVAQPRNARQALYYGLGLSQVDRLDDAIAAVRHSLSIDDTDAEAWDFLGLLLIERQDWQAARIAFDRALALAPGRPQTLFNRATLRLRLGDYSGGFADYESRWDSPLFTTPRRDYGTPRWYGEQLHGETLLLHTEQGLGDTLQFVRFAEYAKRRGAGRVLLECEESLTRLLSCVRGVDEIVQRGQPRPRIDMHAPLMSLAHLAAITLDAVSASVPYLGVKTLVRVLPQRQTHVRLRIGIAWEASRSGGSFHDKSVPLDYFTPLATRDDIELFSLQKGPGADALQVSPLCSRIADLGSRFVDLRDTADVIAQLDLVISVDTAVCHLAGAMGVPVWTLLSFAGDWRWLLERPDSPWYPSMRLWRQDASKDWSVVMNAVSASIGAETPPRSPFTPLTVEHADLAADAHLVAALRHEEQGEHVEAVATYREALLRDASDADVWNNFGVALAKIGRLEESRAALREAVRIAPLHSQAGLNYTAVDRAWRGSSERTQAQGDLNEPRFGIDWQVSAFSGWGIYGMNLVAHSRHHQRFTPVVFHAPHLPGTTDLQRSALQAIAVGRVHADEVLRQAGACPFPTMHALGNGLQGGELASRLRSTRRIGIAFLEDSRLGLEALARGRSYDRIVCGSNWNFELLNAYGLDQIALVVQGIDTTVFHPAPSSGRLSNRFVVFSGGKLEYRKGQDLVIAAFARFYRRHPDSMLMIAWHNHWPQTMRELCTAGHVRDLPPLVDGRLSVTPWLERYGIPHSAVLDVGLMPNEQMAAHIRDADVAVFPNRAEGGTNLVAMETLACAVPTILSANTGHLDLISDEHNIVLRQQSSCRTTPSYSGTDGWGESSIDEIVDALEFAYTQPATVRKRAQAAADVMLGASWDNQIARLFDAVHDLLV